MKELMNLKQVNASSGTNLETGQIPGLAIVVSNK